MNTRLLTNLTRFFAGNVADEHVHFHAGALGRAYASHDRRSVSPGMGADDHSGGAR
jgi:hypothetical protein